MNWTGWMAWMAWMVGFAGSAKSNEVRVGGRLCQLVKAVVVGRCAPKSKVQTTSRPPTHVQYEYVLEV